REERQLLLRAVLEDLEVRFGEVGDVFARGVGDGHVQRDELDAAADALAGRETDGGQRGDHDGKDDPDMASARHRAPAWPVRVRARAVRPGFVTVTSSLSGGINVSGRA